MEHLDQLRFLKDSQVKNIAKEYGTPVFVYSEAILADQARSALNFPAPYGLRVRYAMKANPNSHFLKLFDEAGLCIDASSGYEASRAIRAGVAPSKILITSQELPVNLKELVDEGVEFNACSLHQLDTYGQMFPGSEVSVRINPGIGSGHSFKTNVGGPASSFGIWHEYIDEIHKLAKKHDLKITRLHTHIGSGSDPEVWKRAAELSIGQVRKFPDVTTINLGGGFKVARMRDEIGTDLQAVGKVVANALEEFARDSGRKLHLEIEPGTYLTANAGSLVASVIDVVDTGEEGYTFLKIDSGMTELMRPSLYGSQHPIVVVNGLSEKHRKYVVVGHCCESGDLLTPFPEDPEALAPRLLQEAKIGDLLVIEGVGAYCAYMSAQNYNSFPLRSEVAFKPDGQVVEICRRETLDEMQALETV